jgi:micrococcal nuclease
MSNQIPYKFLIILILIMLAVPAQAGQVDRVIDGDTVIVDGVRIRLWGIDCPERGAPYSREAAQFTERQVLGKDIQLKVHGRDRYGRTVAEIILPDGSTLGQRLTREGLATWYEKYAPQAYDLQRAESRARNERRNIWRK